MSGLPVLSGAIQRTERLVAVPATAETVGAAGAKGGSSTSVRVTVIRRRAIPPLPSSATTVSE